MSGLDPQNHYDTVGEQEWKRLERDPVTQMEFDNTVDYLSEYLPESGRVLDAGGASGRYAIWLAERGYDVELLDLSTEQIEIAREKLAERELDGEVNCRQGDIRELPFSDESFDAVCCLGGPLSHIIGSEERATAMAELRRVASPSVPVFVSVIGRLAMLREAIKFQLDSGHEMLTRVAEDGDYTEQRVDKYAGGVGWVQCHGFRADEFETDLQAAGFTVDRLVGLENIAQRMQSELVDSHSEAVEDVREVVRMLREDRTAVDFSEHMLAVCYA